MRYLAADINTAFQRELLTLCYVLSDLWEVPWQMCMHAHTWKCFYLLRNSHPNISNYSWQVHYCLLTMPEHGVCLGITRPSWHENEFANICFSFSGVSSSKKSTRPTWCLPEWWVKSPHQGCLVSDLYLKWFVVLWLFLLHIQIFLYIYFYFDCNFHIASML